MAELELELRELGAAMDYPPTPDITGPVRWRLAEEPSRRFGLRHRRRLIAVALAVLVVAVAGALAVPSARTALLEWLGIRGVRVDVVDRLPPADVTARLDLGRRVTLAEARRIVPYELIPPPPSLGAPDAVFVRRAPPAGSGQVSFLYGSERRVRLLLTEFVGDIEPVLSKVVEEGATTERVRVDGEPGVWISGAHYVFYLDENGAPVRERVRLADRVLLWEHDGLTFRLEGELTRERALRIARSLP